MSVEQQPVMPPVLPPVEQPHEDDAAALIYPHQKNYCNLPPPPLNYL